MRHQKFINFTIVIIIIILTSTVMYQYIEMQKVKKEMGSQIFLSYISMKDTIMGAKNFVEKNTNLDRDTILLYNAKFDKDRECLKRYSPNNTDIQNTYLNLENNMLLLSNSLKDNTNVSSLEKSILFELNKALGYHIYTINKFGSDKIDDLKCYSLFKSGKL